jgi:hypothetical protein
MANKVEDKNTLTKVKEFFIGTPEQNAKAAAEMKAQDAKNPDSAQAKINRALAPAKKPLRYAPSDENAKFNDDYKKGGKVKAKAKPKCMARGGGCEVRGKTKGRFV